MGMGWHECIRWVAIDPVGIKHISLYKVVKIDEKVEEFDADRLTA
jgi:hypothetical protein